MIIECQRCKKKWDYKGKLKISKKYPQYVSCPRCKTSVKLELKEIQNDNTKDGISS